MNSRFATGALCGAALAMSHFPAAAQHSLRDFQAAGQSDVRATASVTIPLGGVRDADDNAPRLDFALANRTYQTRDNQTDFRLNSVDDPAWAQRRAQFSLTLQQNPRLLVNGERIATFGPRLNADEDSGSNKGGGGNTALYVVGGLLAFGIVGTVIVATDVRDAVSDAIGPED